MKQVQFYCVHEQRWLSNNVVYDIVLRKKDILVYIIVYVLLFYKHEVRNFVPGLSGFPGYV